MNIRTLLSALFALMGLTVAPLLAAPGVQAESTPALPLGHHSHKITTTSPEAQAAFNRGLTLTFGFSHGAAEREYQLALAADPHCAMAWWGIALVNGPHINFPIVPPPRAEAAWHALTNAQALAGTASPEERDLIGALSRRYANPQPDDRSTLDQAYADAMRTVWRNHPRDPDAGALFAEALMDLHPWDLWNHDGSPQPWTAEIVQTLEQVLKIDRRNPGANHYYIHAVEASPTPDKGIASANRLTHLVPGSSHLVHMPSHIYARVGRWTDAAESNLQAMQVDTAYRAAHPNPGFYAMYMVHNAQFYTYTAMMQGRGAEALRYARLAVGGVPDAFLKDYGPIADGFMIMVSEVLMRFGRWDEMLAEPEPRADLPLSRALWHFTRAVALNAQGKAADALTEQAAFLQAKAAMPPDYTFGNNSASNLLGIATHVLAGEIAAQSGQYDEAIAKLRQAARIEDGLRYDEPPDWMQPVRHTLGAVLLRAGRPAEAAIVYREDLVQYPENGWSLFGLERALAKQGKQAEAKPVKRRYKKAWSRADLELHSTCLCQPGERE